MVAHLVSSVQVDGPELRDANDGKHKHQEHQEEAKGTHGWSRLDQRTEDDLQLFGLFDKSEDPTNPECSEDGGGHAQVGSHWQEALHDQDEDGEDHNSEIKDVPSVFEVGAPHGEDLDDSLKCESRHEEVVDVFEWQRIEVWLHVPIEGENQSVQQDQNHDCQVKELMTGEPDGCTPQATVPLQLKFNLRFQFESHKLDLDPTPLGSLQQSIEAESLLLTVVGLNDHSNEQVEEEHANDDDDNHHVNDHPVIEAFYWLHVWTHSVD